MCNPDDENPCTTGTPSQAQIDADTRNFGQRTHDAFTAMGRSALASGELGQHNGLPATIVVSTTLQDLQAARGSAVTAGGSVLPMAEVIRLASHAHHYLAVFDKHTNEALYLGRTQAHRLGRAPHRAATPATAAAPSPAAPSPPTAPRSTTSTAGPTTTAKPTSTKKSSPAARTTASPNTAGP